MVISPVMAVYVGQLALSQPIVSTWSSKALADSPDVWGEGLAECLCLHEVRQVLGWRDGCKEAIEGQTSWYARPFTLHLVEEW